MALESALRELMTQTVTLSTFSGYTAYGVASFGTAKTYAARVEREIKLVKNMQGREVVSTTTVYVGTTSTGGTVPTGFGANGKIVLPTGDSPGLLAVESFPDEVSGVHHAVVYCG